MTSHDNLLREIIEEKNLAELEQWEDTPIPEELHTTVLQAIQQEEEPIQKKGHGRKVILSLLAAVLLIALLTVSAVAAFSPVENVLEAFHIRDFGTGSQLLYSKNDEEGGWLHGSYTFVPKGFSLKTEENSDTLQWVVYKNDKGDELISSTMIAEDSISTLNTEGEGIELEPVNIGSVQGYYLKDKNGYQEIQWVTGKYLNSLSVDNMAVNKDVLLKMARSRTHS